jgi:acyl-CoA synthetase (AMP-forming)/AMP-acid ligase II
VKIDNKFVGDIWGFAYNPSHIAGLQVFFQAVFNFNTIVYLFNRDKNYILNELENKSITSLSATPTFYRLLYPSDKQLKNLKRVTIGGEKSSQYLYKKLQLIFPNAVLRNVYASTEAGSVLSSKGNIFFIDQTNKEFLKIEDKVLHIHKSILGDSDSFLLVDDWYSTGDIIEWVNEKELKFVFVSRTNELINVGGYKINPNEVEEEIRTMDEIKQVVVYGIPNSVLGNILTADIELLSDSKITESEIKIYLKKNLQSFKIPRKINFVKEINHNRSGKISRTNKTIYE